MDTATNIPAETLRMMCKTMLRIRKFEERVAELVSKNEIICPCHLYTGEEAVATGVCSVLRKDDYVFSTHRSHGHYIAKGGDVKALMAELYGKATGCSKGRGGSMHLASPDVGLPGSSAIVAGTIPLAVGTALAFSMQKNDNVSVAFFGDGAANEGTFYESLNFASLRKLPVIFVCENNLYSTHMPISACLADTDIYKKSEAFKMLGVRVDGNNIAEVFKVAKSAVEDARRGKGPTLIECMTYRWRGHVGPSYDLDKGLRSKEELDYWMNRCPIKALEEFLIEHDFISISERNKIYESIEEEIEEALVFAKESPYPDPDEKSFSDVFKTTPFSFRKRNGDCNVRKISYVEAINETLYQMIEKDEKVFLIGQGVISPWYVGTTTVGLIDRFPERVIDTPVSENGITGTAVGAALAGMRPILMHPRIDFMYYAMDQIANHAANWYYMFGGQLSVPITLWGIINRGGEQAAQHSQALQAMFMHIPGLKVVMPSTPYDAKGLLVASIEDDNPVVYIDDRWLYGYVGEVPEELYSVPIGKGIVRREGKDATVVATSYTVYEANKAAESLDKESIDVEVIDLRSLKPLDEEILFSSVRKTGRLVIADGSWKTCGVGAEISALVTENIFEHLKAPIMRVSLPDTPAPASSALEKVYYKKAEDIVRVVKKVLEV